MVQLQKISTTLDHGEGLGTSPACWAVKGAAHIVVRQLGTMWVALEGGSKIATAFDRKTLVSKLEELV